MIDAYVSSCLGLKHAEDVPGVLAWAKGIKAKYRSDLETLPDGAWDAAMKDDRVGPVLVGKLRPKPTGMSPLIVRDS